MPDPVWHTLDNGEVLRLLEVTAEGLTSAAARQRLIAHGPNSLPVGRRRSLSAMLLASSAIS